jgi:hypothetical protein
MAGDTTEKVAQELRTAIDRLRIDIVRVEIWAGALSGFTKPVPNYDGDGFRELLLTPHHKDKKHPNR